MLINRLQQHHNSPLRYFVLEARNAKPALAPVRLLYIVPSNWWRFITARFEPVNQTQQILLQVGRILFRRLTVDPYRAVFARALVGIPYPLVVKIMVQREECHRRIASRQLGYSLLFR